MLYYYPATALDQNWLNPKIIEVLLCGMDAIDAGGDPADWPDCIPVGRREVLRPRYGFRDKLSDIWQSYRGLTDEQKQDARAAIGHQTNLPDVLFNDGPCTRISDLPAAFVKASRDLFEYMFGQLTTLKVGGECIRDAQYRAIYTEISERICPFCGLNYFRAPGAPRTALDHFMPISLYPFVGSDLRNLAPACDECNSSFKGTSDVLWADTGARRRCSDPYGGPVYRVDLSGSPLFSGNEVRGTRLPLWQIELVDGPPEQADAWNTIFKIKERYIRDVLDADFISWMEHFARWFDRESGRGKSADEVAAELPRYINNVVQDGLADRAFLKAEAFRLVLAGCNDPDDGEDVRAWLWGFVEYAV